MAIPAHRFKRKGAFDKQVLGIRVRRAEAAQDPVVLKLTESRIKLMRAMQAGEVKAGQGSYVGEWRWSGLTVTARATQIMRAGWAEVEGKHIALTDAGRAALDGAA